MSTNLAKIYNSISLITFMRKKFTISSLYKITIVDKNDTNISF